MNSRRIHRRLINAALIVVTTACSVSAIKPTVSNVRMATDETGKIVTSTYGPGDTFFVFADLRGIKAGSAIEARWYTVSVAGVGPNLGLDTSTYVYQPAVAYVSFQLTNKGGSDWPTGSYRVEIYLDNTKVGDQGFTVQ